MPPKAKAAAGGKGRAPAKRKLAEEFPPGEVLTDTGKKSWKLGAPVGQGGFGLIYLADENSPKPVGSDARYVIKVEPSESGPLFSELKFYMRAAKPELIQNWMRSHKLKSLGVPKYWGSGLHEKGGRKYRFMVIDRLGTDLQKKFEECGKRFPRKLVLQLGVRLLDTLEYIHEHEYVHADIKASNLMLSYSDPNQVYLVDYGLAYRYSPEGVLKEYKEDPKRCHDGTIEFTSIDAHKGASPSRRADLEILGYCLVQWLCGRLPWEDKLKDPSYVRDSKIRSQDNLSEFMAKCFPSQDKPDELQKFMEEVKKLGYQDQPPYDKLRSILQTGLKALQAKDDGKLEFIAVNRTASPRSTKTFLSRQQVYYSKAVTSLGQSRAWLNKGGCFRKFIHKATKRKIAVSEEDSVDGEESPVKKKKVTKKKEVNGVKKSPVKSPKPKKALPKKALPKFTEMATQTSPGLAKKPRGRPKKTAS